MGVSGIFDLLVFELSSPLLRRFLSFRPPPWPVRRLEVPFSFGRLVERALSLSAVPRWSSTTSPKSTFSMLRLHCDASAPMSNVWCYFSLCRTTQQKRHLEL